MSGTHWCGFHLRRQARIWNETRRMILMKIRFGRGTHPLPAGLLILAFLLVSACHNPVAVPEAEIPPVLGIDSAVVGPLLYACGRWREDYDPPKGRMIVDLFFGRSGPEAPPDCPLADQVEMVERHGGEILHVFNFPAVRVDIRSSRIPDLYSSGLINLVGRGVPYRDRYDWPVLVWYEEYPTAYEYQRFEDLGGRITKVLPHFPSLAGDLPDASFPLLRADSGVESVEASGIYCRPPLPAPSQDS